ncbi:MAG: shikimate dehydrogenase, partial [Oscillospiraceae bacterium]|nr:shikimate dehydrogenase [Oscillospiraceae bacterium]
MENEYRLIGYPLSHSISPIIHKRLFELSGNLDARYSLIEIEPSQMKENFQNLFNLSGFNVTIPYKEFVYENLKELDESAKRYGSVNVVPINADGICKG